MARPDVGDAEIRTKHDNLLGGRPMGHHLEKSGGGHVGAGDEPASSPRAEPQSLRHQGRPRPVARRLDSPLTHLRCTIAANPPSAPSGTPPRHSAQPPAHPPPARSSPPAPPGSAPESEPAAEAPGPSRRDDPRTDRPASSAPQTPVLAARPLPPEIARSNRSCAACASR